MISLLETIIPELTVTTLSGNTPDGTYKVVNANGVLPAGSLVVVQGERYLSVEKGNGKVWINYLDDDSDDNVILEPCDIEIRFLVQPPKLTKQTGITSTMVSG